MFTKKVSMQYVIENNGMWICNYPEEDKWIYYWVGEDLRNGKQVKVSALDALRHTLKETELKLREAEKEIYILKGNANV